MKILWITYAPLGRAAELIENKKSQSGTWIDATAKAFLSQKGIELTIACISSHSVEIADNDSGIRFVGIGNVEQVSGQVAPESDCAKWKSIIKKTEPHIIMIWGTEYANGLSVLNAAGEIPVLFFIQGVMGRIVEYPLGLLPMREVVKTIGLAPTAKFLHFLRNLKRQKKQKIIECQMVKKCAGIITDNEWAKSYYRTVMPNINIYNFPLPINEIFLEKKYNGENVNKHSIFTIDGCNPSKGVYHLIKAVHRVKQFYPDVHLYIPGRVSNRKPNIIFESPYYTYLKKLVKKLDLKENVTFCGQLTSEQMKEYLLACEVFVMPSCVENHSSSLREAMYLGVPCITTIVGSIDEFTKNGEDVLSYRYEEEDTLADNIIRLFKNKELAMKLGRNAYQSVRMHYPQENLGQKLYEIYEAVINE